MVVSVGCDARDSGYAAHASGGNARMRVDIGRRDSPAGARFVVANDHVVDAREVPPLGRDETRTTPLPPRASHISRAGFSPVSRLRSRARCPSDLESRRLVPVALRLPAGHPPARPLTRDGHARATRRSAAHVFGGTGMVGSAIAAEAVRRGLSVTCVTRGGAPPAHIASSEWGGAVRWLRGDALEPDTYRDAMRHHDAVVTSVGRLPLPSLTHEEVVRDNGETNIIPGRVARELGVPRLVVVGASIPAFVPGMAFGFSPSRGVFRAGYAVAARIAPRRSPETNSWVPRVPKRVPRDSERSS